MSKTTNLKHVSAYLPHGVNMRFQKFNGKYDYFKLAPENLDFVLNGPNKQFVLRPLSDLVNEIEVDGKKFTPVNELSPYSTSRLDVDGWDKDVSDMPHLDVQKLLFWHFDIFGLIESGDAVNFNDVKEELK